MTTKLEGRVDIALVYSASWSNPNGDPDMDGRPRTDPQTGHALVTDVALKRKVRNHVAITCAGVPGHDIFVSERAVLGRKQALAWDAVSPDTPEKDRKEYPADALVRDLKAWMCANFWDVRAFGAVMSTGGAHCGQVKGPVQLGFSRSAEPVLDLDLGISRMAISSEDEIGRNPGRTTMGRKHVLPFALFTGHCFVSAVHADAESGGTGFGEEDLETLLGALAMMFEHDRAAGRAGMAMHKVVVFRHESIYGNHPAHKLLERVRIERATKGDARAWSDYRVEVDTADLPRGVSVDERQ